MMLIMLVLVAARHGWCWLPAWLLCDEALPARGGGGSWLGESEVKCLLLLEGDIAVFHESLISPL